MEYVTIWNSFDNYVITILEIALQGNAEKILIHSLLASLTSEKKDLALKKRKEHKRALTNVTIGDGSECVMKN